MIFEPVIYKKSGGNGIVPKSLTIDKPPDKTEYTVGETFNSDGMEVWVDFSNGKSLYVLNSDLSFSPTDLSSESIDSIDVSLEWGEKKVSTNQPISVLKNNISILSWHTVQLPYSGHWDDIVYFKNKFIAIDRKSGTIIYSSDGINWSKSDSQLILAKYNSSLESNCMAYSENVLTVIPGYQGDNGAYSSDGTNYQLTSLSTTRLFGGVVYGSDKFLAFDLQNDKVAISTNGITWQTYSQNGWEPSDYSCIVYGNNRFILTSASTVGASYSEDGINWTPIRDENKAIGRIIYATGEFWGLTSSNKITHSKDGINWTIHNQSTELSQFSCIDYHDELFVALCTGNKIAYSKNGIDWSIDSESLPTDFSEDSLSCNIAYGNGKYVAISKNKSDTIVYAV